MAKFRKRPVVIEAYQTHTAKTVGTWDDRMFASVGDWIITGEDGVQVACKPDIFALTYEAVEEGPDDGDRG